MAFHFEPHIRISVTTSIEHSIPGERVRFYKKFWNQEMSLTKLLGSTVIGLDVIGGKELNIDFSNGHSIRLEDDSQEYESFEIKIGDDLIIQFGYTVEGTIRVDQAQKISILVAADNRKVSHSSLTQFDVYVNGTFVPLVLPLQISPEGWFVILLEPSS